MEPILDHIQITVKDIKVAEAFYDQFLPLLGYSTNHKISAYVEEYEFHVVEYFHPLLDFG